jgi:phenylacetic acid degradation operon negative regulatory protein
VVAPAHEGRLPDLGIAPLTARSLVLTALLGTHPPQLPVRALVALGQLFGMAEGAMRTALSRMVAAGEVEADEGRYTLGDRMRRRQATQDEARRPGAEPWDGTWWFAIVVADRRSMAQRRAFRTHMRGHRMGELRPDVWLRPANVARPAPADGVLLVHGEIDQRDPVEFARQLWDLDDLASRGRDLTALVEEARSWLEGGDPTALVDTVLVSVAAVRFLRTEPQLPRALVGGDWPPNALRTAYDGLERAHAEVLASFLTSASTLHYTP